MKTYTNKKAAFEHAMKRATNEGHRVMVVFNRKHKDMVVRKDLGQKMSPEQIKVAVCDEHTITDGLNNKKTEWRLNEMKHGLQLS